MELLDVWQAFAREKSFVLSPTTMAHDYVQVGLWLARCPHQSLSDTRLAMYWLLEQQPHKAAKRVAQYLKSALRWAATEDVALIPRNPLASFQLPKNDQLPEPRVIAVDKVPVMLEWLRESASQGARWDLIAALHLQTGLRPAEGFGLTWDDVDWDNKRLRIARNLTLTHGVRNRTKTGRERWVPCNGPAMQILHTLRKLHNEPQILPWSRTGYMTAFRRTMQRMYDRGLIPARYRPYDLRHTNISVALERGIPVTQVASWAGNSAEMCWRHYAGTTGSYTMPSI
jgi:hypothetical protein